MDKKQGTQVSLETQVSKKTFFGRTLLLTAALVSTLLTITLVTFVLSSCSIPTGGEGNLTLILPDGKFVTYTPGSGPGPNDASQLTYIIHGSGPGILSKTVQGGGAISLSVVPGNWTIQVTVKYGTMLYAESVPQSVNVTAGGSNVALIELGPAWSAGNDVDFGGDPDKYAYFSDSDGPNDLYNYLSGLTTGNHVVVVEGDQHQTTTTELVLAGGKISLRGSGTFKRVGTGARSLFNISSGGELIVRGPTLQGDGTTINKALVTVDGGILTLYEGRITGAAGWGNATGGVVVENGGIFTMEGGTISNNTNQSLGGGVAVTDVGSKFFMKGGTINGNKATDSGSGGAGVYVNFNGEFTMEGGTISGNTATLGRGGGVLVTGSGTFTMSGGTINGNNQATDGGGVYVPSSGTFTKYNISGNSGSIENNTASGEGQQVYKAAGTLHQRNTGVGPGLNMSTATTDDTNPPWEL